MRVLLTGGTGFIGQTLVGILARPPHVVRLALRRSGVLPAAFCAQDTSLESVLVGDISSTTDWRAALSGIDAVVHAAARVHIADAPRRGRDNSAENESHAEVNARGTQRLASEAARVGVRRFIYLSSIKVNGEGRDQPYSRSDVPNPTDAYARSKWLAEQYLAELAREGAMQVAVVRPPLVYGPGVKANFLRLLQWVDRELPLPLGAIQNRRSLVSVWNLCDLITRLLEPAGPTTGTWLVADGEDLSTPALIRILGRAMGRRVHLLSVPPRWLELGAAALHRREEVRRLSRSLTVDVTATCRELGWTAPVPLEEGLERTVSWYLESANTRASA